MSFTRLAVLLLGLYLIIQALTAVSSTLTLIWGIAVVVLVILDGVGVAFPARRAVP